MFLLCSLFASLAASSNAQVLTEKWYNEMPLDHFSFTNTFTFKLRYKVSEEFYRAGGPIFFYCGNEGTIDFYINNTGIVFEWAREFSGAVVYAEHRFYGKTQPFGDKSYSSVEQLGYLTSEQALGDYAQLIVSLKKETFSEKSPVIAFGGSYGGMLAAWIRIKYPHIVSGAVASSAPVFMFLNTPEMERSFYGTTTRTFVTSGCDFQIVNGVWGALRELAKTAQGRAFLNRKLNERTQIESAEDVVLLIKFAEEAFVDLAMADYPYATDTLSSLPAWPVKSACESFKTPKKTDEQYAEALFEVLNLQKNYTGDLPSFCINPIVCALDDKFGMLKGWTWQTCTEMVIPVCGAGPPSDFFEVSCPVTTEVLAAGCESLYGGIGYKRAMMRRGWVMTEYGSRLPSASNIVFSNGLLDAVAGGGWAQTSKVDGSVVSLIVKDGAHMYDLQKANANDTESVKEVREEEMKYIARWIREAGDNASGDDSKSGTSPWVSSALLLSLALVDLL